ncbi:hypothetical protein V8C37DRAFT_35122 [Trichoderma ceciliae]
MSDLLDCTVGWVCIIGPELVTAPVFLDEEHAKLKFINDNDDNVVHSRLVPAAIVAKNIQCTSPNFRIGLMVGIGGGLGVVVGQHRDTMASFFTILSTLYVAETT